MNVRQIDNILSGVNYSGPKPRLIKCVAAHNEEGWIEYNLSNCYDEFDLIRVVEGAVRGRPSSTPDGHSTDRTLEIIRDFPDPDNKIELFVGDRHFKSLEEQKQTFIDFASEGDFLLITDCDEFYLEGTINKLRKLIELRPTVSELIPTFLHFYRDSKHVRDYNEGWNCWHQRIIRYQPGMRYHTHPVVSDANGRCTYFDPIYQKKRFMVNGLYIYHYGHIKSAEFHKDKAAFYKSELSKFDGKGGNASIEFDAKLDEFLNYKENLNEILLYDGPHPKCLENHPLLNRVEDFYNDKSFRDFKESKAFNFNLPTIPQWMSYTNKMTPVYNNLDLC